MSCLKGESTHKKRPGNFECKSCGAVVKKKGKICKPRKIKGK